MEYGYIAFELLIAAKEAEREDAAARGRWVRELAVVAADRRRATARRARIVAAVRALVESDEPRPARRLTRAVRRVAGSIRASSAID